MLLKTIGGDCVNGAKVRTAVIRGIEMGGRLWPRAAIYRACGVLCYNGVQRTVSGFAMTLRVAFSVLVIVFGSTSASYANGEVARGRMICEVVDIRTVTPNDLQSGNHLDHGRDFQLGNEFNFEYGFSGDAGFSIYLSDASGKGILIDEAFSISDRIGISRTTGIAEFRAPYSEASFGLHRMNYKGNDQLFLKSGCNGRKWSGHFLQTHVSRILTTVVSLDCRATIDALDDVLVRLAE